MNQLLVMALDGIQAWCRLISQRQEQWKTGMVVEYLEITFRSYLILKVLRGASTLRVFFRKYLEAVFCNQLPLQELLLYLLFEQEVWGI